MALPLAVPICLSRAIEAALYESRERDKTVARAVGLKPDRWSKVKVGTRPFPWQRVIEESPLEFALAFLDALKAQRLELEKPAAPTVESDADLVRDLLALLQRHRAPIKATLRDDGERKSA
jgi:hypothetical protein